MLSSALPNRFGYVPDATNALSARLLIPGLLTRIMSSVRALRCCRVNPLSTWLIGVPDFLSCNAIFKVMPAAAVAPATDNTSRAVDVCTYHSWLSSHRLVSGSPKLVSCHSRNTDTEHCADDAVAAPNVKTDKAVLAPPVRGTTALLPPNTTQESTAAPQLNEALISSP